MQILNVSYASFGYQRLRFVRALAASFFLLVAANYVLIQVLLIAMKVAALAFGVRLPLENLTSLLSARASTPVAIAAATNVLFVTLEYLVPGFLVLCLAAWLLSLVADIVHRRLFAIAIAVPVSYVLFGVIVIFVGSTLVLVGIFQRPEQMHLTVLQSWLFTGLLTLIGLIAWECFLWCVWQITASRSLFLAARGWRPPHQHIWSTIRRTLGLPSYLSQFGKGTLMLNFLYLALATANCAMLAIVWLTLSIYSNKGGGLLEKSNDAYQRIYTDYLAVAAVGLVVFFFSGGASVLSRFVNRVAANTYQRVRQWDQRAPVVFLRPFLADEKRLQNASWSPMLRLAAGVGTRRNLEMVVFEHASPYGPTLAIGDPSNPFPQLGAARIFVQDRDDQDWQHIVSDLVANATAVIICPERSNGVRWELQHLIDSGALAKTIILASPTSKADQVYELFESIAGERIERAKKRAPVAMYLTGQGEWVVVLAYRLVEPTYATGLNLALQQKFGTRGAFDAQGNSNSRSPIGKRGVQIDK